LIERDGFSPLSARHDAHNIDNLSPYAHADFKGLAMGLIMVAKKDVTALIEGVVREKFADAGIEIVRIEEGRDHEGDAIFNITVVFNNAGPLDSHKTSGIARHVRHKLLAAQENAFPIFTFMSKSDAARLKPEAA